MKTLGLLALGLIPFLTAHAQMPPSTFQQRLAAIQSSLPPGVNPTNAGVNYTLRVEWKDTKKPTTSLQIVTSEGRFSLDTVTGSVKINNADVPTTVRLSGSLTELSPQKGRLQLFLGRTIPYVTSSFTGPSGVGNSSYSQLSVGLDSTFAVTYGKPLVIQMDDNGTVSILVQREE